jgi:hypothetical protein
MNKNPPAPGLHSKGRADLQGAERRREPRRPASGTVRLSLQDPVPREMELPLMDVSASGFRAIDYGAGLASGQAVRFQHMEASGHARVIWHRVLPDHMETGFLVVDAVRGSVPADRPVS